MKSRFGVIAWAFATGSLLALAPLAPAGAQDGAVDNWSVIHAGTLITDARLAPRTNASLIVRNGVVDDVRDGYIAATEAGAPAGANVDVIELRDATVMSGLIDTHTHLSSEMSPRSKVRNVTYEQADFAIDSTVFARRTLDAGFTAIRDPGDELAIYALKRGIEGGKVAGPRILTAGRIISATGGHGQRLGYNHDLTLHFAEANTALCDGIETCRKAVREQVAEGADFIKIAATGGVLTDVASGTGQQFTAEELNAIVEVAHMLGKKVACHAHDNAGIIAALKAGVDSIEHGSFADGEALTLLRKNGAYLVPTLLAGETTVEAANTPGYFSPAIAEKARHVGPQMIQALARAHKAGVRIAFGTDTGVSKHGENAREFGLLVKAGLSPREALVAATVNAADLIGLSGKLGTLEPGKYADIIATRGNPLQDIATLSDVAFVMKGGVVYKNALYQGSLK